MISQLRLVVVLGVGLSSAGCVASVGAALGPNLETTGPTYVGLESELEVRGAVGGTFGRGYSSIAVGGGYLGASQEPCVVLEGEAGFESGTTRNFAVGGAGLAYGARVLPGADTPVRHSLGPIAHFEVLAEDWGAQPTQNHLYLGGRLGFEHVWGEDGEHNRVLVSTEFTVRYVFLDPSQPD